MTLEEEMQKRGLLPSEQTTTDPLLAEMQRRGLNPVQEEKGLVSRAWDATKQAVQGNAEFKDAGNWQDYVDARAKSGHYDDRGFFGRGPLDDVMQIDKAGTFGNVEDQINMIKERFPDARFTQDANQNPMLVHGDQKFYINKPGLDLQDVGEGAGEAALYALGGGAGAAAKGLGLAARMGATGVAETALNAGAQKMAGRDEIDGTEMAIAGLAGGLFEGLAPAVSKVRRSMKNSGKSNKEAGKEIAQEMGLSLNSEQTERLGDLARNLDPSQVDMNTIIEHVELNQTPTLGTLTKNRDILETENALRHTGRDTTRKKLQMLDDANETGLQRAMSQAQTNMGGSGRDYYTAAQDIGDAVSNAQKAAKSKVNDAYNSVQGAFVGSEPFRAAPQRFRKALSNEGVLLAPSTTKRSNDVLNDVSKSIEMMGDAKGVSWQAVEAQRKRINSAFAGAEKSDARALQIIKNEYDEIVDEAFSNSLLSGSEDAIKSLTKARSLATDYFKKFESKEEGGRVIKQWLQDGTTPEDISNAFLSKTGVVGKNAPKVAKAYLDVVGRNTPEHVALKELAIQRFTADKGRAAIRNKLKDAMTNGKTFMNEVFTPKELGFLSRTVSFIDGISQKGINARSSGSAERFFRWLNQSAGNDVSLSGLLNGVKKTLSMITGAESRATALPTRQIAVNPAAVGAAQGSTALHNYPSNQ